MSLPRLATDGTVPLHSLALTEFASRTPRFCRAILARSATQGRCTARRSRRHGYTLWGKRH
jgi:hypothetical protein